MSIYFLTDICKINLIHIHANFVRCLELLLWKHYGFCHGYVEVSFGQLSFHLTAGIFHALWRQKLSQITMRWKPVQKTSLIWAYTPLQTKKCSQFPLPCLLCYLEPLNRTASCRPANHGKAHTICGKILKESTIRDFGNLVLRANCVPAGHEPHHTKPWDFGKRSAKRFLAKVMIVKKAYEVNPVGENSKFVFTWSIKLFHFTILSLPS